MIASPDNILSDLGLTSHRHRRRALGNNVDESVDQMLDGLSIGPHNIRRRAPHTVSRQVVANVNTTVKLGELGGAIDGLVEDWKCVTSCADFGACASCLHSCASCPIATTSCLITTTLRSSSCAFWFSPSRRSRTRHRRRCGPPLPLILAIADIFPVLQALDEPLQLTVRLKQ